MTLYKYSAFKVDDPDGDDRKPILEYDIDAKNEMEARRQGNEKLNSLYPEQSLDDVFVHLSWSS